VKDAAAAAGISKRVTCHTFRHNADSRIMPTRFLSPPIFQADQPTFS